MRVFVEIAYTGLVALLLHPLQNLATLVCLWVVLVPYLCGIGISQGVQAEAEASVAGGADLYVSGEQFGRPVAIPRRAADYIRRIDGVTQITPRMVGAVTLGNSQENAVVVGLPAEALPSSVDCIAGRLFAPGSKAELVVGSELARRLKLRPGSRIPPFYHSSQGEHVSQVVGVFHSDASLWQAHVMFTSLESAAEIFDQPDQVTDLLVDCRSGYQASVHRQISRILSPALLGQGIRPRVISRQQLAAMLPRGLLHREGIFNLHFLLAAVAGALAILVTSGFGLSERRREIGILKAIGWQTDEVLLRSVVESFLASLFGAALAIVLAYVWLRGLNGLLVAGIFLADVSAYPDFPIPFRLTLKAAVLAFIFSFVMVMSGTLYSTWRAATVSPRDAMR